MSLTNTDDDTAGITVSPTAGLVTTEAGGTATFTVVLTSQPTADVTIGLTSSDLSEGTVSAASVTFTPANWNVAQTVTVTGVDDAVDDGDIAYTIVTAAAVSGDPAYSGLNGADVSLTNSDNDGVGSTIVELLVDGLLVSDLGNVDDNLIVSRNGPNIRIHSPSNSLTARTGATQIDLNTVEVLFASVVGSLMLNTGEGNDSVTIAFFGGDPLPAGGVVFHGGPQSGSPGDRLSVVGTGAQVATYLPNGAVSACSIMTGR